MISEHAMVSSWLVCGVEIRGVPVSPIYLPACYVKNKGDCVACAHAESEAR